VIRPVDRERVQPLRGVERRRATPGRNWHGTKQRSRADRELETEPSRRLANHVTYCGRRLKKHRLSGKRLSYGENMRRADLRLSETGEINGFGDAPCTGKQGAGILEYVRKESKRVVERYIRGRGIHDSYVQEVMQVNSKLTNAWETGSGGVAEARSEDEVAANG